MLTFHSLSPSGVVQLFLCDSVIQGRVFGELISVFLMKGDADAVIIAGICVSIALNKLWLQSECTHRPPARTHSWPHGVTGIKTVINKLNDINNTNKCTLLINYAVEDLNSNHVTGATNDCCHSVLKAPPTPRLDGWRCRTIGEGLGKVLLGQQDKQGQEKHASGEDEVSRHHLTAELCKNVQFYLQCNLNRVSKDITESEFHALNKENNQRSACARCIQEIQSVFIYIANKNHKSYLKTSSENKNNSFRRGGSKCKELQVNKESKYLKYLLNYFIKDLWNNDERRYKRTLCCPPLSLQQPQMKTEM